MVIEEVLLMRTVLRAILAFFTLGVSATIGCNKSEQPPPSPADVVLTVPGMY
jgi:hypothetical protein